jgi:arylsulfatase A-like enzyme
MSDSQSGILKEIKHSLGMGLILGVLAGSGLAFYSAYYSNQFLQKSLQMIALELFFEMIVLATVAFAGIFFIVFPGMSLLNRPFKIRDLRLARFALAIGGLVFLLAGYYLNKSSWFPPVASLAGVIGNAIFALLCLGLIVGFYKAFGALNLHLPRFGSGMMRRLSPVAAVLLIPFLAFSGYAYFKLSSLKPAGPNLVILSIDTLRADRLGCYGYERDTSPTIDRLAREGTLFKQTYAQRGLTWPSLTSIMTSLYPKTHGVLNNQQPLDGEFTTLAEMLKNVGYKTGAFLANFYHSPNRGFDTKKGGEVGDLDKAVTSYALEWLDSINPNDNKFFMWVHYKNPHDPYEPPKPFTAFFDSTYTGPFDGSRPVLDSIYVNKIDLSDRDLAHLNSLYDAEIRSSDSYLEKVLAKLEKMGVLENTLIIFTSDHGEEMYEHNHYFFHSCSMYEGVLRVPLIMKFPNVIPAGKIVDNQVESIDILPTVLQLLKVPLRDEFEGRSVISLLFEDSSDVWHPAFGERAGSIYSIRTPHWKYIYNPDNYHTYCSRSDDDEGGGYIIEAEELYDVQNDPHERDNIVEQHREVALELRAQILEWLNTNKREHKEYELTKEAEERLRALGYIK